MIAGGLFYGLLVGTMSAFALSLDANESLVKQKTGTVNTYMKLKGFPSDLRRSVRHRGRFAPPQQCSLLRLSHTYWYVLVANTTHAYLIAIARISIDPVMVAGEGVLSELLRATFGIRRGRGAVRATPEPAESGHVVPSQRHNPRRDHLQNADGQATAPDFAAHGPYANRCGQVSP